jgi:hypothetical protein
MFTQALKTFEKTGCFKLTDAILCIQDLNIIKRSITPDFPFPQFYLDNITLVYDLESLSDAELATLPTLPTVAVTLENYLNGQRRELNNEFTNFSRIDFDAAQNQTEVCLFQLLGASNKWTVIGLDYVTFYAHKIKLYLSEAFFSYLFRHLIGGIHHLKLLSFKGYKWDPSRLGKILANNQNLNVLRSRVDTEPAYSFIDLTLEIAKHPSLQELDLLNTFMYKADYTALDNLLYANYRIEKIYLPIPKTDYLQETRTALQQRLSQPPFARFKKEQLNQNKLLDLAINAIMYAKHEQFSLLVKQSNALSQLTPEEKKEAYAFLPTVYQTNLEHLATDWSLIQLDVRGLLDLDSMDPEIKEWLENSPPRSVGRYLLEIAIAYEDAESIQCLLDIGVNIFEHLPGPSILTRLFEKNECTPWVNVLREHLQKGWPELLPQIVYLKPFPCIYGKLIDIKHHLDHYFSTLIERNDFSWNKFYQLQDRKKEWERAIDIMVQTIEKGTQSPAITSVSIREMYEDIALLVAEARKAKRKTLFGHSALHDVLEQLGTELQIELKQFGQFLEDLERANIYKTIKQQEIPEQIKQLEIKLKNNEEELKLEKEMRAQDKQKMEELLIKAREEIKEALQTEMAVEAKKQEERYQLALGRLEEKLDYLLKFFPRHSTLSMTPPEENCENNDMKFFKTL